MGDLGDQLEACAALPALIEQCVRAGVPTSFTITTDGSVVLWAQTDRHVDLLGLAVLLELEQDGDPRLFAGSWEGQTPTGQRVTLVGAIPPTPRPFAEPHPDDVARTGQ